MLIEQQEECLKILREIQMRVRAAKDQRNDYAGFQYRNVEKMLTEIKPILAEYDSCVVFEDEIIEKAGRWYVKATATIYFPNGGRVSCSAYAREQETIKGQISAQITGGCSTYARKYALCGLLAVSSGDDPDSKQNIDMITPAQVKTLIAAAEEKNSEISDICKYFNVNSLNELSGEEYGKCLNMLNKKK